MHDGLADLRSFAQASREANTTDVVLLGMGGSSLGPEVLRCTFGSSKGSPRLWVLDSTVPGWVRHVTTAIQPARTLFLVASKSGGTIEVMSTLRPFWGARTAHQRQSRRRSVCGHYGSRDRARTACARSRILAYLHQSSDIGGRYSVLSYFGLVPAALLGLDVGKLLARALAMREACRKPSPVKQNPGAALGAMMGTMVRAGRDKLTLITSPAINSFGLWVEQLLAESTGKEGTGLIPIAGEPLATPKVYGADRVFVYLRLKGDRNTSMDRSVNCPATRRTSCPSPGPGRSLRSRRRILPAGSLRLPLRDIRSASIPSINPMCKRAKTIRSGPERSAKHMDTLPPVADIHTQTGFDPIARTSGTESLCVYSGVHDSITSNRSRSRALRKAVMSGTTSPLRQVMALAIYIPRGSYIRGAQTAGSSSN